MKPHLPWVVVQMMSRKPSIFIFWISFVRILVFVDLIYLCSETSQWVGRYFCPMIAAASRRRQTQGSGQPFPPSSECLMEAMGREWVGPGTRRPTFGFTAATPGNCAIAITFLLIIYRSLIIHNLREGLEGFTNPSVRQPRMVTVMHLRTHLRRFMVRWCCFFAFSPNSGVLYQQNGERSPKHAPSPRNTPSTWRDSGVLAQQNVSKRSNSEIISPPPAVRRSAPPLLLIMLPAKITEGPFFGITSPPLGCDPTAPVAVRQRPRATRPGRRLPPSHPQHQGLRGRAFGTGWSGEGLCPRPPSLLVVGVGPTTLPPPLPSPRPPSQWSC